MADMVQLQFFKFNNLTIETMGKGVHLHLKGIFRKQISSDH